MNARDVALQIAQVVTVIALSPLLQGVIQQWEERVQRARGPGIFQPYRDLWKFFHKQLVVPDSASWIYWTAPIVAFTCMLTVPILIPVLTDFPLPLSDMGDILGGGLILTLGSFAVVLAGLDSGSAYGGIGSSRAVMLGILAEPTLILVLVGITLLAESRTPLSGVRLFRPAARGDGPLADPFEHAYRGLYDRGGSNPRVFGTSACTAQMGVDDEAVHSLHHILQRADAAVGTVAARHRAGRIGCGDRSFSTDATGRAGRRCG
jgi:hypothetical protein